MKGSVGTATIMTKPVSRSRKAIKLRHKKVWDETKSTWINPRMFIGDMQEVLHRKLIKCSIINNQQREDHRKDGMDEWHTMFNGDNKPVKVVAMSRRKANMLNKFNRNNGIPYRYSLGGA